MTSNGSRTFSVIITSHSGRDFVLEAIRSVQEQTFPAHEIIVVLDGELSEIAAKIAEAYPDVRVFEQPNLGVSVARNLGVAKATGTWLCFLDDDDLWHCDKLKLTAAYLESHPNCRALRNPVWFFKASNDAPEDAFGFAPDFVAQNLDECHAAVAHGDCSRNSFEYLSIEGDSFRLMLEKNRGILSSTVLLREVFINAGGFCAMQTVGEEWTLFVNVARLCEWHIIPQRLGFHRLHLFSNTQSDMRNGLFTLAGQINAWFTGRPLPHRTHGMDWMRELVKYGPVYRKSVQSLFWTALGARQFKLAQLIRRAGRMLLPRTIDWIYIHIPPQVTWRLERYIPGMDCCDA